MTPQAQVNGTKPRSGLAPEVLQLLSEVDVCWTASYVCGELALAVSDPEEAARLRQYAERAKRGAQARTRRLDDLGIGSVGRERRTVRCGAKVFILPDRAPDAFRQIVHTVADVPPPQPKEVEMPQVHVDPNPALNGVNPPASEPTFFERITSALRLPTLPEAAVGLGVAILIGGLYIAFTGEAPPAE